MMESKYGTRRGLGSRKILIVLAVLCTVIFWMAGSLYGRRITPHDGKFEEINTAPPQTHEAAIITTTTTTAAPEPAAPMSTVKSSDPKLKHFWGVPETPEHLRGEGARNRTQIGIEKASLVMLVRNKEQKDALMAMKNIEERFNQNYRYPWTFLNDEPFTESFKLQTSRIASGEVQYGLIPHDEWSVPDFIDETKFQQSMKDMEEKKIIYGGSESYRHMCRYNSGFFWRSELLKKFDWYWRVEPSTGFYCDQLYDPFTFMRENNKRYSFVMTLFEFRATIETLWASTREFAKKHPEYIAEDNSLEFLTDSKDKDSLFSKDFNLCHFWSNFEIADLNLWRSEEYRAYFDYLDKKGGFFYERWGDAPVHSIAAALFLQKDQIHFWHDMGYRHPPYERCPTDEESHDSVRCMCPFDKAKSFDFDGYSCQKRWWAFHGQDDSGKPIPQHKIPYN